MDETPETPPVTLPGLFVNLYDAHLKVVRDPVIAPDTRWLLADLSRYADQACVVGAAGRISGEMASEHSLAFNVAGMAQTTCAVRVKMPVQPARATRDGKDQACAWDESSHTALLEFPNKPNGVDIVIEW
jgi:hypothetical protein